MKGSPTAGERVAHGIMLKAGGHAPGPAPRKPCFASKSAVCQQGSLPERLPATCPARHFSPTSLAPTFPWRMAARQRTQAPRTRSWAHPPGRLGNQQSADALAPLEGGDSNIESDHSTPLAGPAAQARATPPTCNLRTDRGRGRGALRDGGGEEPSGRRAHPPPPRRQERQRMAAVATRPQPCRRCRTAYNTSNHMVARRAKPHTSNHSCSFHTSLPRSKRRDVSDLADCRAEATRAPEGVRRHLRREARQSSDCKQKARRSSRPPAPEPRWSDASARTSSSSASANRRRRTGPRAYEWRPGGRVAGGKLAASGERPATGRALSGERGRRRAASNGGLAAGGRPWPGERPAGKEAARRLRAGGNRPANDRTSNGRGGPERDSASSGPLLSGGPLCHENGLPSKVRHVSPLALNARTCRAM